MFMDHMWNFGLDPRQEGIWQKVHNTQRVEQRAIRDQLRVLPPWSAMLHTTALHQILGLRKKVRPEPMKIIIGEPDKAATTPTVIASAMYFAAMFKGVVQVFLAMSPKTAEKYQDEVSTLLHRNVLLQTYFQRLDPTLNIPPRWFNKRAFRQALDELSVEFIDPDNLSAGDAIEIGDFLAQHLTTKDVPVKQALREPVWVAATAAVKRMRGIEYCFAGKGVPSKDVANAAIRLVLRPGEKLTSVALLHRRLPPDGCPHLIVLSDPAVNRIPTIDERVECGELVARIMRLERIVHETFAHPDDAETGPMYMGALSYSTNGSGKGGSIAETTEVAQRIAAKIAHMGDVYCLPYPMQGDAMFNADTTKGPHTEGYGRCGGCVAKDLDTGNSALKFLALNVLQAVTSGPILMIYHPDNPHAFIPCIIGDQSRDDKTRALVQSMIDTLLLGFLNRMQGHIAGY